MKKLVCSLSFLILSFIASAQESIDNLLAAGVNDAERYANSYLSPATNGALYSLTGGWFNNGAAKDKMHFELSIVGNAALIQEKNKYFTLNTADYEFLQFQDGSPSKSIATVFGHHENDIIGVVEVDDGMGGTEQVEIILPTGFGSKETGYIPSVFIQGSLGLFLGTEIKARFFPPVDYEGAKVGLYGIGVQHEFTKWLVPESKRSLSVSGLIAYTRLNASYDFTDTAIVAGTDQRFETAMNTWLFQLIASKKISILSLYGGIGYGEGHSQTDLKGTYMVNEGVLAGESVIDPFSMETTISGLRGTLGANVKIGVLSINADYTLAEFDTVALGLNFSF